MRQPKYRVRWKRHEADMFGTMRVWKNGSLLLQSICEKGDAEELARDLKTRAVIDGDSGSPMNWVKTAVLA